MFDRLPVIVRVQAEVVKMIHERVEHQGKEKGQQDMSKYVVLFGNHCKEKKPYLIV